MTLSPEGDPGKRWGKDRLGGVNFDPVDSVINTTGPEGIAVEVALGALYQEVLQRSGKPECYDLMD